MARDAKPDYYVTLCVFAACITIVMVILGYSLIYHEPSCTLEDTIDLYGNCTLDRVTAGEKENWFVVTFQCTQETLGLD